MKIKGWKEVFRFTFYQQVKTKSFIISTVVMALIVALISFLADFLPVLFLGDEIEKAEKAANGESFFTIEELYVSNKTGKYSFDLETAAAELGLGFHELGSAEAAKEKLAQLEGTDEKAMVTVISCDDKGLILDSRYAASEAAGIDKVDCETVTSRLADEVRTQYLTGFGVPEEELEIARNGIYTTVSGAGEEPVSFVKQMINTIVPMVSSIVLFVFIFSYSQLVAQSVAIEKSSRVIEYLLTSIKPLAIILGKVLAMCCVSLMQFIIIGAGGAVGFIISLPFGIFTKVNALTAIAAEGAEQASSLGIGAADVVSDITDAFNSVDASALLIMIVTFVLGFLLFAGLAGLAGASISKMEDLSAAIQPLSLIGVLGFYLAYFPQVTGEENSMSAFARYLPISSPFILPSDYLLGRIGIGEALISIIILIASDIAVMLLVAKVYETIILHTGNRLKLGEMLKMSK